MNNTYPKKYTDALRELVETNTTFTSLVNLDVVENFCKEANLSFRPRNLKKDVGQKSYNIIFINTWRKKESITLMKYLYSNCNIYLERKYSLGKPFL